MARPRTAAYAGLPDNLHITKRSNGGEYYKYRSPITKKTIGLGGDRERAIEYANEANQQLELHRARKSENSHSIKHAKFDSKGLLDGNSIVHKSITYDHVCGVYFLIHDGAIVYVGQSKNVLFRLAEHRRDDVKLFQSFYFIECKASELDNLEALYIQKFKPVHNTIMPYVQPHATAWSGTLSDLLAI